MIGRGRDGKQVHLPSQNKVNKSELGRAPKIQEHCVGRSDGARSTEVERARPSAEVDTCSTRSVLLRRPQSLSKWPRPTRSVACTNPHLFAAECA